MGGTRAISADGRNGGVAGSAMQKLPGVGAGGASTPHHGHMDKLAAGYVSPPLPFAAQGEKRN